MTASAASLDDAPAPVLQELRADEHAWANIAPRYGVTNPDPPWKVSLYATLECLSAGETLPSLERRHIEDRLGETIFRDLSGAELQLVTLAQILLKRGVLSEQDLAERLRAVRARLEAE